MYGYPIIFSSSAPFLYYKSRASNESVKEIQSVLLNLSPGMGEIGRQLEHIPFSGSIIEYTKTMKRRSSKPFLN